MKLETRVLTGYFGDLSRAAIFSYGPTGRMSDKIVVRCPSELKKRAEALAKIRTRAEGKEVTASDVYRRAIKLYLDHMEDTGSSPTFIFDE